MSRFRTPKTRCRRIILSLPPKRRQISRVMTACAMDCAFTTEMYLNDIFTVTVNMAGLPGISVPSGLDAHGLPLGLQVIGRPFAEETLFALGAVIEKADGRFIPERWW